MQHYLRTPGVRIVALATAALFTGMLMLGPAYARADTSVSISDNSFSPQTITIAPGQTVTWTNNGAMNHTVTADDGSFTSGTLNPGNTFSHTYGTVGSFPYFCQFHGAAGGVGMSGVVIVSASASSSSLNTSTSTNNTSTSTTTGTTSTSTGSTSTLTTTGGNGTTSTSTSGTSTPSSGGTGTSTSATSTSATSTSAAPILSNGHVVPNMTGATISWTTNVNADAQVSYGATTAYTTTTASDNMSSTSHSVVIAGLSPGTLYHFMARSSANGMTGMSPDETFTTLTSSSSTTTPSGGGTGTSTATTTPSDNGTSTPTTTPSIDINNLSIHIAQLEAFIKTLQLQIQIIFQGSGLPYSHYGNGNGSPGVSTLGSAVYADSYSVSPGGAVHFNGEGFGANENVAIMVDGMTIGYAHTDANGDFSVNGTASNSTGDTTYWFTGQNSGKSDSVMITTETGGSSD